MMKRITLRGPPHGTTRQVYHLSRIPVSRTLTGVRDVRCLLTWKGSMRDLILLMLYTLYLMAPVMLALLIVRGLHKPPWVYLTRLFTS